MFQEGPETITHAAESNAARKREEAACGEETLILTICVVFVGAGVALMLMAMKNRRYMRELAHRERMAMIERGLVPAPESDPVLFEAATGPGPEAAPGPKRG